MASRCAAAWYNIKSGTTITQVDAYAGYSWLQDPYYTLEDSITFNWDSGVFSLSSFYSYDLLVGPNMYTLYNQQTRPSVAALGGAGWYAKLGLYGWAGTSDHVEGQATFRLIPRNTLTSTQVSTAQFTMHYVHNKRTVSPSFGFSISGPTVSISSSGSYDEASVVSVYYSNK